MKKTLVTTGIAVALATGITANQAIATTLQANPATIAKATTSQLVDQCCGATCCSASCCAASNNCSGCCAATDNCSASDSCSACCGADS